MLLACRNAQKWPPKYTLPLASLRSGSRRARICARSLMLPCFVSRAGWQARFPSVAWLPPRLARLRRLFRAPLCPLSVPLVLSSLLSVTRCGFRQLMPVVLAVFAPLAVCARRAPRFAWVAASVLPAGLLLARPVLAGGAGSAPPARRSVLRSPAVLTASFSCRPSQQSSRDRDAYRREIQWLAILRTRPTARP